MSSTHVHVARRAVLDEAQEVFGYELLVRGGPDDAFVREDGEQAAIELLDATLNVFDPNTMVEGRRSFVAVTRRLLVEGLVEVLPARRTVVLLPAGIRVDPQVVDAVRRLAEAGFTFCADVAAGERLPLSLAVHCELVRLHVDQVEEERFDEVVRGHLDAGRRVLATGLESRRDRDRAVRAGCTLFQGPYYCRPDVLHRRQQKGCRLNYLALLQELGEPELKFGEVEEIFRREPTLAAKLLRYLNSAQFGLRNPVTSIRQALVHLGERSLRRWGSVVAVSCLGDDRPSELITTTLVRARFTERLGDAANAHGDGNTYFLTGLLSTLDALFDCPLEEALEQVSIAPEIKSALVAPASTLGRTLRLVLAYEGADWPEADRLATALSVSRSTLTALYLQSVRWTDILFADVQSRAA